MQYVYPAIFYCAKEGGYCIEFPDVDGAFTQAETLYEALEMAEDALAGMLTIYEDSKAGILTDPNGNKIEIKNRIVEPTPIDQIKAEPDEYSTSAFVTLIKADTDAYRKAYRSAEKDSSSKNVA